MARRAVPDHAVGGVDGFVGGEARQAQHEEPKDRGYNAIGGVLGEAFDGGAGHAGAVERLGIAAHDARDRPPAAFEAVHFERRRHVADMGMEAAACEQRACGNRGEHPAVMQAARRPLDDKPCCQGRRDTANDSEHAREFADAARTAFPVEPPVRQAYQSANPGDGVADRAENPIWVADGGVEQQGEQSDR